MIPKIAEMRAVILMMIERSSVDWIRKRQKKIELVQKLQRLAKHNPEEHESRLAAQRAAEITRRYGL